MRTLADLNLGESAVIADVVGDDAISIRLLEMGLLAGEPISLIARAPFGDPIEFEIRGYRLSLRRTEAERVCLEDAT